MSGTEKPRIWELDALRGLMMVFVVAFHSLFYASVMLGRFRLPEWLLWFIGHAGLLFVVLSGLCAHLGSRGLRRGALVFAGGMVLTLGSWIGVLLGLLDRAFVIRFGVLHLLGFCMMLSPVLKKLPTWALGALGLVVVIAGYAIEGTVVQTRLLFPLGLMYPGFSSGDYFPILPHLGWFCLGLVLGRLLYQEKKTRLPGVDPRQPLIRLLTFCGRNSLWIFILHLPLIGAVMGILSLF